MYFWEYTVWTPYLKAIQPACANICIELRWNTFAPRVQTMHMSAAPVVFIYKWDYGTTSDPCNLHRTPHPYMTPWPCLDITMAVYGFLVGALHRHHPAHVLHMPLQGWHRHAHIAVTWIPGPRHTQMHARTHARTHARLLLNLISTFDCQLFVIDHHSIRYGCYLLHEAACDGYVCPKPP